jgi:UDP:flavonoid glycosyltransferase YjiC (YdhE family)
MRVLFTTNPVLGHFLPLVPVARALESAGDVVAFAAPSLVRTGRPFAVEVTEAGFESLGLGPPDLGETDPGMQEVHRFLAARPDLREFHEFGVARLFPEINPRAILPYLVEVCDRWQPDLVVSDNLEFAGRVVAESRSIPHAAVQVDASCLRYPERDVLVPQMDALRARVGLPPDPNADMQFRYLYLVNQPSELQSDAELPPTTFRLRRVFADGNSLPDWVATLPRRPTVYVTAGTFVSRFPGVLERLLEAIASEPVNVIFTVGHDRDPSAFGSQPPNVHIEHYLPQSRLMPYCDAVLSHGGSGTVLTALDHGLPLVNVPIGADQFVNSERCADVGVGLTIGPEQRHAEAIRAAVREVLANPTYRDRAREIQHAIHALPGPEAAVPILEGLAAR